MLRLVIGVILCVCSMYIGYGIRRYYSVRAKFYRDILAFVERLIDEISFMKPPLAKILSVFESNSGEFARLIRAYSALIAKTGVEVTEEQVDKALFSIYISKNEREVLNAMMISLGTLDSATQLHNLSNYKARFQCLSADCDTKCRTVGALSFKLGVLVGILAMIIVA